MAARSGESVLPPPYPATVNPRQRQLIARAVIDRTVNGDIFSPPISANCSLEAQSGNIAFRDNALKLHDPGYVRPARGRS
jgi:hypothetical protein